MDKILEAYLDQLLLESLNSPYTLTDVTHLNPEGVAALKSDGYSMINLYSSNEDDRHSFITGFKDGAFEVHHQFFDGTEKVGNNFVKDITPSKFVSPAFSLIKQKTDAGYHVRIVAPKYHVESYHRLINRIASKFGVSVTNPEFHDGSDPNGDPLYKIHIMPPKPDKGIKPPDWLYF